MTDSPELKWGMLSRPRTGGMGAMTIEQKFALLAGIVYVVGGVIGFFVTGFDNFTETTNEALLIFELSPFHNVVHIGVGAVWLIGAFLLTAPATEGLNFAIGAFYVLAAVLGALGALTWLSIDAGLAVGDFYLHLVTGLVTLVFAGPLNLLKRQPAATA